jgi:hypothetical protein
MACVRLVLVLFAHLLGAVPYVQGQTYEIKRLAGHDHLVAFFNGSKYHVQYHCVPSSLEEKRNELETINMEMEVLSLAVGTRQNRSQMYFVVIGKTEGSPQLVYMSKVTVPCLHNHEVKRETVFFDLKKQGSLDYWATAVDPRGHFAVAFTVGAILIFDLNTLQNSSILNVSWPEAGTRNFYPLAVNIGENAIFLTGYNDLIGALAVYSLNLTLLTTDQSVHILNYSQIYTQFATSRSTIIQTLVSVDRDNTAENVLFSVYQALLVHVYKVIIAGSLLQLRYVGFKQYNSRVSNGAWFGQKVIVSIPQSKAALTLRFYEIGSDTQFSQSTVESFVFPNNAQSIPHDFSQDLAAIEASPSALYLLNKKGQLLVVPTSQPGYYSVPYVLHTGGSVFSFVGHGAQCPPRRFKNDTGIWPCYACQPVKNNSVFDHISRTCSQCSDKEFCPGEFMTDLDAFVDIVQVQSYPESPKIDVFDDIVLFSMFRVDCGPSSPFFLTLLSLVVVSIFSILVFLMKLLRSLRPKRKHFLTFFRHLDLIGEGELWFGGIISITLLFFIVLAVKFSHTFHAHYPIESVKQFSDQDSCSSNKVLNAKFESKLQFFSFTPEQQLEPVFNLLNSQKFKVSVDMIQTDYHCGQIRLIYAETEEFLNFSCYQSSGTLYVGTDLPVQKMTLKLELYGNHTVAAVRCGITAPQLDSIDNVALGLNFSKRFNKSSQRLAQNVLVNLDLTKVNNITEGLTDSGISKFSAIWTPTFTFDINAMFVSSDKPVNGSIGQRNLTTLSIVLGETPFFVKNTQKPIARRSEIIFHTFLFISACIDLLAMIFLLLKLWFFPLMRFFLKKLLRSTGWLYRLILHDVQVEETSVSKIARLESEVNSLKFEVKETKIIVEEILSVMAHNDDHLQTHCHFEKLCDIVRSDKALGTKIASEFKKMQVADLEILPKIKTTSQP